MAAFDGRFGGILSGKENGLGASLLLTLDSEGALYWLKPRALRPGPFPALHSIWRNGKGIRLGHSSIEWAAAADLPLSRRARMRFLPAPPLIAGKTWITKPQKLRKQPLSGGNQSRFQCRNGKRLRIF